jgi:hypothetical protein
MEMTTPLTAVMARLHQQSNVTTAALQNENRRLREALAPFAKFAELWEAKPLSGMDDIIYRIHAGTEWDAELRLSDCQKAREILDENATKAAE